MDNFKFTKRVLFIGVPDMAYVGLDTLLYARVNIIGVVGPSKTHNTYPAFKNFVNMRGLNFIEYDKLNSPEFIEQIKSLKPDIAVVCSFNNKFPKALIDAIPNGIINIHPSLLPQYRGGNPYSWVIINNEKQTGVTLHFISEEFDEGDIIAQVPVKIYDFETMGTIFNRTNDIGSKMLLQALVQFEKTNTLPRKQQPVGDFIKAPNIKDNQLFIDFNKQSEEIERFVRALNPYLTAITVFNNQIVRIHKVTIANITDCENFSNGEICKIENNKVYIKTANGCIIPEVLQYSGYFTGDCSDFIKIVNPKIGDKFTNGYT